MQANIAETSERQSWFEAGWSVGQDGVDEGRFPPLNDMEAQRSWLGGFGAAWVECPDAGELVDEVLVWALVGRAELLRQLRSHRKG
jgi:hypothetical protein